MIRLIYCVNTSAVPEGDEVYVLVVFSKKTHITVNE
jgi:hypothetical protein